MSDNCPPIIDEPCQVDAHALTSRCSRLAELMRAHCHGNARAFPRKCLRIAKEMLAPCQGDAHALTRRRSRFVCRCLRTDKTTLVHCQSMLAHYHLNNYNINDLVVLG